MSKEIDVTTGQPYSPEFLAIRSELWTATTSHNALTIRRDAGDESVTDAQLPEVEAEHERLLTESFATLEADRERYWDGLSTARESRALAAPLEAAIARALHALRDRGPLTASEIEAMRLPGLSKNAVRPVLRKPSAGAACAGFDRDGACSGLLPKSIPLHRLPG